MPAQASTLRAERRAKAQRFAQGRASAASRLAPVATPVAAFATLFAGALAAVPMAVAQPQASLETFVYPADEGSQAQTLYCGRQPVTAQMLGQWMAITLNDDTRMLMPVRAASGARYQAVGDSDTEFWGKGDLATLTWSGNALPTCAPQNALVLPFQAQGNEPFWQVSFDGWEIALRQPGEPATTMDGAITQRTDSGLTLQGTRGNARLQLEVTAMPCVDSMTGMPYPQSATLTYGELSGSGCAGDPARLLQGGEWLLTRIGDAALDAATPTLSFLDDGRVAGMASCNRMMGSYRLTGESLQVRELATTSMFCSEAQMMQEQQVLRALESVRGFRLDGSDGVIFASDHGDIHASWRAATP